MKSLWGKISKSASNPVAQDVQQSCQSETKQITIDYYQLRSVQDNIKKLTSIKDIFEHQNTNVSSIFEDLMGTLQGLINVIQQLKQQAEKNAYKIKEYDRLKSLVSQHSEIIAHMQDQSSKNLTRIYEQKRHMQHQLQQQIKELKQRITDQQDKMNKQKLQNNQKSQINMRLKSEIQKRDKQIKSLIKQKQQYKKKIGLMTKIQDSSLKFQNKGYALGQTVELSTIFVYSKLRKCIYSFLGLKDFHELLLTNRQMHYICNRTLKKQFIGIMMKNKQRQLSQLANDIKYYQKIYDSFPPENIKTNAIKYLYFKIKPGAYMLPYLQNQEQIVEKNQQKQKSKLSQLSSFFRKKNQNQNMKQKSYTFQTLKNDHDFKQVYKKIQIFFDKLFKIQTTEDLKIFNQTMKRQLNQLKFELKNNEKSLQILCMSKYLYIEINQLNNLLQVCFAILINKHNDLKQYKKKNDDLIQNDKVLRNLVENIANDRQQVQRRIFFLQNQNLKFKSISQKLEQQLKTLKQASIQKNVQNEKLNLQLKRLKQKASRDQSEKLILQQKWQQVLSTIKQIPFSE